MMAFFPSAMGRRLTRTATLMVAVFSLATLASTCFAQEPLPSWRDGNSKQQILSFIKKVTDPASKDYVSPPARIATFDNDGTLWAEQPFYFQLMFAFDRVRQLAPSHPDWRSIEPYASIIKGDYKNAMAAGEKPLLKIVAEMHAGVSSEEFNAIVSEWFKIARHPTTQRPYNEMIYQPMLELLDYLRANGFRTFIVSGGGIDFLRVFAEQAYGIPPEQVVGSSLKARYEVRDGVPVIIKQADLNFVDDKEGKPVGIHQYIGRRPIFAAGNSDGDYQMLQWTTTGAGARFGMIVHHTDAKREWAYDRDSAVGHLAKGLDDANAMGWTIVDMKAEWKTVYPGDKP